MFIFSIVTFLYKSEMVEQKVDLRPNSVSLSIFFVLLCKSVQLVSHCLTTFLWMCLWWKALTALPVYYSSWGNPANWWNQRQGILYKYHISMTMVAKVIQSWSKSAVSERLCVLQALWLPSILWRKREAFVFKDHESWVRLSFALLGWHLRIRYANSYTPQFSVLTLLFPSFVLDVNSWDWVR